MLFKVNKEFADKLAENTHRKITGKKGIFRSMNGSEKQMIIVKDGQCTVVKKSEVSRWDKFRALLGCGPASYRAVRDTWKKTPHYL